jgi:hypothetical protein
MTIYYLVYKTTHLPSGHIYIGRHVTDNLNDGYYGSGTLISKFLKKYDKTEFSREIIHFAINKDEMLRLEDERISEVFSNPLCLNCVRGDPSNGLIQHSEYSKKRISEANRGKTRSKETCDKMSIVAKNRSPETRAKMSASAKVKVFTEEHRRNIGKAGIGRKNSPEHIEKTRLSHIGSKRSEETKLKIKEKRANQILKKKHWILLDPSGNIIETTYLKEFCKKNKLGLSKLLDTKKTKQPVENGFSTGWMILNFYYT